MGKIPSISMIFEKTKDEKSYTNDALLYQNILNYAMILNGKTPENNNFSCFTTWKLTGWLIDYNQEFINAYKDLSTRNIPTNNRIAARLDRVEYCIEHLYGLGLVTILKREKASRGNTDTHYFQFTSAGYVLAWLIQSLDPNRLDLASEEIYNTFYNVNKNNPQSNGNFGLILFKKYKEKGVFGDFVVIPLRTKITSNKPIRDIADLLNEPPIQYQKDENKARLYSDLWIESFNELNDDVKILLMHKVKLDNEKNMQQLAADLKGFEKLRYELKDIYDMLALEVRCTQCHLPIHISVSLVNYVKNTKVLPNDPIYTKCSHCNQDVSVALPVFDQLITVNKFH